MNILLHFYNTNLTNNLSIRQNCHQNSLLLSVTAICYINCLQILLDLIFFVLLLFYFFGQKGTRAADIDEQSRRGKEDWCEVEIIISLQFESCFATHFLIIEFYSFKDIHILQPSPKAILI